MLSKAITRGITLIEVLAATTVFVIALGAMLASALSLFKTTIYRGEFLVATNLAREGLEIIRNRRDDNFQSGAPNWRDGFNANAAIIKPDLSTGAFQGKFTIESVAYTLDDCVTNNKACQVFFDSATGLYGDVGLSSVYGATSSKFYRMLEFAPIQCQAVGAVESQGLCVFDEEIGVAVKSRAQWYQGAKLREVVLETTLFNWQ